jgi:regulator of protease activity HflC (stomatin/prohibitin superfamily)
MNYAGKIGAVVLALILVVGGIGLAVCSERIPAGYVGVVYSMSGGVEDEVLQQGWHLISPTKKVKEFTVSEEQLALTVDNNKQFPVSTSDNANIDISFQMSYSFIEEKVPATYQRFKGMDGEDIINNRVVTVLKSKISEVTASYSMMEIYSGERATINKAIKEYLDKELGERYGITVTEASIIDVHPDEQLQKTIDERVTAMQKKQQAEAEQDTIKVQNDTKLLQAEAEAKKKVVEAQAAADAKLIAAEAEAKANKIIADSITEGLLKKEEMEARKKHGWVTVQGAGTVVATN